MKDKIIFTDDDAESEASTRTKQFFLDYIDLIEKRNKGVYIE